MTYAEAQELTSLPWSALSAGVTEDLSISASNLRLEVEAILHEVEEGFVDPKTTYPGVERSAAALLSDLRRQASSVQEPS
jgi:hypothetical protein